MADDDQIRFTLRIPRGLFERIGEAADAAQRSANAEIFSTLLEKYGADDRDDIESLKRYRDQLAADLKVKMATEMSLRDLFLRSEGENDDTERLKALYLDVQQAADELKTRLSAIEVAIQSLQAKSHVRRPQKVP